jgi:hypothetical protein
LKKNAGEGAESLDQMARIAALERRPRQLQKKFLESLVRLRRLARSRISGEACQSAPICLAKRLKTTELHIKPTLDSQIESRKYVVECPIEKCHQSDPPPLSLQNLRGFQRFRRGGVRHFANRDVPIVRTMTACGVAIRRSFATTPGGSSPK